MMRMTIATPMNVEPNGFPTLRRRLESCAGFEVSMSRRVFGSFGGRIEGGPIWECPKLDFVVGTVTFRRKSWVTAIPMDAKARDVRIQARNVRSRAVRITRTVMLME